MSAEEKKALVRRFYEAQAQGDFDALEALMSPDFVDHSLTTDQEPGREGYLRSVAEDRAAFSDLHFVIEDQMVADDGRVISRLTTRGTHDRGEFADFFAPTGQEREATVITIHRIVRGKIAEEWSESGGLLEATRELLEQQMRERERVDQELLVARRIQHALLPKSVPALVGWEIAPYYQPAREVGGDFYDFVHLPHDRVGLVIGDVSGKGIPAAVLMASTQSVLRALAQRRNPSPSRLLAEANEALYAYIPPNMFVTCFYAILEPESGHLGYANAGHTLPCCRRHDGGQTDELLVRGMPLGLMPGMSYEEDETTILQGDSVLFCTDGLVEAHDPQGEMFGSPRLRRLVSKHLTGGTALSTILVEELERFTGERQEQEDDITLLALERSPIRS